MKQMLPHIGFIFKRNIRDKKKEEEKYLLYYYDVSLFIYTFVCFSVPSYV